MKQDIYRAVTFIVSAKVGEVFLTFLIAPLLIRFLGADYGNYTFVISVLAIATLFLNGGVYDGLRKFLAERADDADWHASVFSFYVHAASAVAAVVVLGFVAAVEFDLVRRLLGAEFELYFYLLGGMLVARVFFIVSNSALMGLGREQLSEPLYSLHRLLFGVFGVGMAATGYGVAGVLLGDIVATTLVMVAGLVLVARRIRVRAVLSWQPASFPRETLLRYSSMSVVLSLLFNSLYHVDILLLRPLTGAEPTAHYKAALLVAEFLWVVPLAVQNSLVHVTSSMWADEQYDSIDLYASRITRYTLLLHALLALGVAALAEPFVRLYFGPSFDATVLPLLILLPGALGYALARPLIGIVKGSGQMRVLVAATAGSAALNLVLNLVLIPRFGMQGAAVATTVGYGSVFLFSLWGSYRVGFDPLGDLRLGSLALTAGATAPVVFGLRRVVEPDLLALVVVPPVGFVVYTLAAFWTGAIARSEVAHILDQVPVPVPLRLRRLFQT